LANRKLHIVALDVPFPADYGGAIDMYYRIKALHELGLELTLHVFEYGRGQQPELEKFGTVHYYKRTRSVFHLFSKRPFIVQSRYSKQLLNNLSTDDVPILMEGLHTCAILEDKTISQRMTFVRMHNIEHEYYTELARNTGFLKRIFFLNEAKKLKRYLGILKKAKFILAIKESDREHFEKINPASLLLPACSEFPTFAPEKTQPFALFHGNLSVPENENGALWLIETLKHEVNTEFPLVIAGKNPSTKLVSACDGTFVKLIPNPPQVTLNQLIESAHIHVFHSDAPSGVKLKLLNVLGTSGHILCNENMIGQKDLSDLCTIENEPSAFANRFVELKNMLPQLQTYAHRKSFIHENLNASMHCTIIKDIIDEN
jgi:uncharacterized protein YerC